MTALPVSDDSGGVPSTVVELLRADLISGVYHPRERLVEADLADRYAAKRSAVRAALIELTGEGLIEREPNRGARVRAVTLEEAIEITSVRRVLEGLSAGAAAERGTDDERARLQGLIDEMHTNSGDDIRAYHAHSAAFHGLIQEMSRHATVNRLLLQLRNQSLQRHFPLAFAAKPPAQGMEEHDAIAAAIIAGDVDAAEAVMRDHMGHVIDALRRFGIMTDPVD